MRIPRIPLIAVALTMLATGPALADKYVSLPTLDNETSSLKIRFVDYTGGTNGEMIVDVKNTGKRSAKFVAESLFFVPKGDPESAPQRLGAAGPFRTRKNNTWIQGEQLDLRPGETRRVRLQVFCIDSHRGSPGADQGFTIARKRLPKKLRREINTETKRILHKNKGNVNRSKSSIQSHIWKSRDANWVKLEGERKVEKAPRQHREQLRNAPNLDNAPRKRIQRKRHR